MTTEGYFMLDKWYELRLKDNQDFKFTGRIMYVRKRGHTNTFFEVSYNAPDRYLKRVTTGHLWWKKRYHAPQTYTTKTEFIYYDLLSWYEPPTETIYECNHT